MTRATISVLAMAVVALGGCEPNQGSALPPQAPSSSPSATLQEASVARCSRDIPFEVTYLPDGFRWRIFNGPAQGDRRPDRDGQVIVHLRGSGSRAVEIRRPGTEFSELAQGDDAPTIEVLGNETSGFAPIAPGGDDYIVQFTFPAGARSTNHCAVYSLNEYGVSLEKLKKVAEGLRLRD